MKLMLTRTGFFLLFSLAIQVIFYNSVEASQPAKISISIQGDRFMVQDDTILDKKTGLMWYRTSVGGKKFSLAEFNQGKKVKSSGAAIRHKKYSDWRYANLEELKSIMINAGFNHKGFKGRYSHPFGNFFFTPSNGQIDGRHALVYYPYADVTFIEPLSGKSPIIGSKMLVRGDAKELPGPIKKDGIFINNNKLLPYTTHAAVATRVQDRLILHGDNYPIWNYCNNDVFLFARLGKSGINNLKIEDLMNNKIMVKLESHPKNTYNHFNLDLYNIKGFNNKYQRYSLKSKFEIAKMKEEIKRELLNTYNKLIDEMKVFTPNSSLLLSPFPLAIQIDENDYDVDNQILKVTLIDRHIIKNEKYLSLYYGGLHPYGDFPFPTTEISMDIEKAASFFTDNKNIYVYSNYYVKPGAFNFFEYKFIPDKILLHFVNEKGKELLSIVYHNFKLNDVRLQTGADVKEYSWETLKFWY